MRWQPNLLKLTLASLIILTLAVVVYGFASQSHRISSWEARYDSLFESYQQLDADCAVAEDCETDAPSPAEVQDAAPATPGAPGQQGEPGADGRDGRTPTAAEVLEAVRLYCAASEGCAGPQGTPGSNGANGADGADGQPGAPGANGLNGADGRGIASVSCAADESLATYLRFSFTDGTTTDVRAECTPSATDTP